MPNITTIPFDFKTVSLSIERDAKRSPGIHLSTILKDMRITAGVERKFGKPLHPDQQHAVFQTGFMWENAVVEYIQSPENVQAELDTFFSLFGLEEQKAQDAIDSNGAIVRPGECSLDGIYLTPDGINMKLWYVHEWKATGIRSKGFSIPERRIEWLWQVGAYCKVFDMTRAIIRVFHTGDIPQNITQHVIDFSKEEIENNWHKITEHLDYMRKCGRA